jgi:hypothetical protein
VHHCFVKPLIASLVLLTLSLSTSGQAPRDSRPDKGEDVKFYYRFGRYWHEERTAKLRVFVWQHWSEKRPGRIRAFHYGIDGGPTITAFAIKKDRDGIWVVNEVVTRRCWTSFGFCKDNVVRRIYHEVSRVELTTDSSSAEVPKPIPADINRDPREYAIRLRARDLTEELIF